MVKKSFLLVVTLLFSVSCILNAQASKSSKTSQHNKAVLERIIHIDFSKTAGPLNTMFKECVGAGRANEGLRADWQQQLAYVKKRMRVQIHPHAWFAHR